MVLQPVLFLYTKILCSLSDKSVRISANSKQVFWLRPHYIVCLPITCGYSDILDDTLPLQRRYRAGFTPASLLAHAVA